MRRAQAVPVHFLLPRSGGRSPLSADVGKDALRDVCGLLNERGGSLSTKLRWLVAAWQAEPNLRTLLEKYPALEKALMEITRVVWYCGDEGKGAQLLAFAAIYGEGFGRESLFRPNGGEPEILSQDDAETELAAVHVFWTLTLNTHCEKLAGPCARCGDYFIPKRATQKVYCSRRCGNASTAVARTRARLQADHASKMERAEAAIRAWNALKTRGEYDWREWLGTREPDITGKFITRHVNAGKLPEPKRGRSL